MRFLAALLLCCVAGSAEARGHRHWAHHHYRHHRHYVAYHDGRPRAWCGWEMRRELGVADPRYNVARNWAHWGANAGGPRVGAVVVWVHHVGRIVGGPDAQGRWLVHSGNDGNQVRTRYRSLAGAIAFRWGA